MTFKFLVLSFFFLCLDIVVVLCESDHGRTPQLITVSKFAKEQSQKVDTAKYEPTWKSLDSRPLPSKIF